MDNTNQQTDALVVTALLLEYKAVLSQLGSIQESTNIRGVAYRSGVFATVHGGLLRVAVVQLIEAGNEEAALATFEAAHHFKPKLLMFVGIAGGVKDVQLGDVVVATKVYGYTAGVAKQKFQPRPNVGESNQLLLEHALFLSQTADWYETSATDIEAVPKVFVGPIAAGDVVVKDSRSSVYRFLRSYYDDALAVDMEGRGFLRAAKRFDLMSAVVIRGISDQINNKTDTDQAGWQPRAARHAALFAFKLLARSIVFHDEDEAATALTSPIHEEDATGAWDEWLETAISQGAVFYDDPWESSSSEAEAEFKSLLKGRNDEQFGYWRNGNWGAILQLWAPLLGNEYFDVLHPYWEGKPYFRRFIHQANCGLFAAHAQMTGTELDTNFDHYRASIQYLNKVLQEPPYSMLGAKHDRLSTDTARIENENYIVALEFANRFLNGWGGPALVIIDIDEGEAQVLETRVQTRLNELRWILSKHPQS